MNIKRLHYRCFSFINALIPKNKRCIFFYDSKFQRQNCWALLLYLVNNGLDKKYEVIYYTTQKEASLPMHCNVQLTSSLIKGWWKRLRAKYVFFEYLNHRFASSSSRGQINFNIWHGMPLKKVGYISGAKANHPYNDEFTYMLSTSPFYSKVIQDCFGAREDQIFLGGNPRNDLLYEQDFDFDFFSDGDLNVLWMPTFRKSTTNRFNDSSIEFPLLSRNNIDSFNDFLSSQHIKLLIKLHPFQDRIEWLCNNKSSNIKTIYNNELFQKGIELYQVVGRADVLITDYSSIFLDYLLLDRPIVFTNDDMEEYTDNRGFLFEDIESYMPGPKISNIQELQYELTRISKGNDLYKDERAKVNSIVNTQSHEFSKSIIDFLKL